MTPVLAFSAGNFVETAGAYAGFFSIIGLAVLSLLYFAQARELKRLRDWAGRAPERAHEMQTGLAARPAPIPSPTLPPGVQALPPYTAAGQAGLANVQHVPPLAIPIAPPGVAAPALASGTRFRVPTPVPTPLPRPGPGFAAAPTAPSTTVMPSLPANGGPVGLPPLTPLPASKPPIPPPAQPPAAAPVARSGPATPAPPIPAPLTPAPLTPAPASAASAPPKTPTPPPQPAPAPAPAPAARVPADPPAPARPPAPRNLPPAATAPPHPPRPPVRITGQAQPLRSSAAGPATHVAPQRVRDPAAVRWTALVAGGVGIVVLLIVLLVTGVFSSGSSSKPAAKTTTRAATPTKTTATTPVKTAPPAFVRADSQVFVLNGTLTSGLAKGVASRLQKAGFGGGANNAATATNQSQSATVIYYQPGHRRDALEVQKVLTSGSIQPLSVNPAICNVPAPAKPCQADAIVVVGADQVR